jgi:AdoMet-dependent heme synthase
VRVSPLGDSLPTLPADPGAAAPGIGTAGGAFQETAGNREDFLPHVVAWNLTRRCNLACAHCYISAGSWHAAATELSTPECHRILDQLLDVNPNPMLILSGGEPLLRDDLEELARHATEGGATVVVGTNGTRLTGGRITSLMEAGVRGVAVSIDSLDPTYHDRFRHGDGALQDTLEAVDRLERQGLDFVIQTSLTRGNRGELPDLVAWAADRGATSFNLYFLVPTGRGDRMQGLSPAENEDVLTELAELERTYRGRMMIRSKCQPQLMRHVHRGDPASPLLNYRTRCPCGVQYCRITPEGKVTPCPYTPVVAGDLMERSFGEIWRESPVFHALRHGEPGGRCGRCEYREVCGGCRARAHAMTGDLLGPDDSCAYEPTGQVPLVEPPRTVTYGSPAAPTLPWSEAARKRMDRVPSFVRGVIVARVEAFAREQGREVVDEAVLAEVRRKMPVDFSKRLPFFLRRGEEA